MEKKLDGNCTRMLRSILNEFWRQHPKIQQLYDHLPPISKTIKVRRTRHAEHCWKSKDELMSDILLWIPSHRRAKAGPPARTYIQKLCADTGFSLEDLLGAMGDRDAWRERVREIHASGERWWWCFFRYSCRILSVVFMNITNRKNCLSRYLTSKKNVFINKDCKDWSILQL